MAENNGLRQAPTQPSVNGQAESDRREAGDAVSA